MAGEAEHARGEERVATFRIQIGDAAVRQAVSDGRQNFPGASVGSGLCSASLSQDLKRMAWPLLPYFEWLGRGVGPRTTTEEWGIAETASGSKVLDHMSGETRVQFDIVCDALLTLNCWFEETLDG